MSKHVDIKCTVWTRSYFEEDADMQKVIELLREGEDIHDEKLGFTECETLFDTEVQLTPEQNNGDSTVEVYDEVITLIDNRSIIARDSLLPIWENGKSIL